MFENFDDLLTVEEVCEMLKMGRDAVYGLLGSGQLRGFRNGRNWRVSKDAVIHYICESSGLRKEGIR